MYQYLRQNRSTCKGFRRFIELLSTTTTTLNPQEALNGHFSTFAMPPPRCHEDHVAPIQPCRPGNARHDGACDNVGPVPVGGHGGELSDGATLFFDSAPVGHAVLGVLSSACVSSRGGLSGGGG